MAASVLMRMTTLDRMLLTVPVTTTRMPATSLATRLCISPVFCDVKNPNDSDCRCEYRRSRKSRITRCPTCWVSQVCSTPSDPVTTTTTAMAAARVHSSGKSGPPSTNSAESNTTRMRIGLTTPRPAVTSISRPMASTRGQWGWNAAAMRRFRLGTRRPGRRRLELTDRRKPWGIFSRTGRIIQDLDVTQRRGGAEAQRFLVPRRRGNDESHAYPLYATCHCEEHSDVAISLRQGSLLRRRDCHAALAMTKVGTHENDE